MANYLYISGIQIEYLAIDRRSVKGIWVDAVTKYTFGTTNFQNQTLLLLILKAGAEAYTPAQSKKLAEKLQHENNMTVVYCFDRLDFNGRERMMAQGVYFIVGKKYAFLPMLRAVGRADSKAKAMVLSAPAQYLLIFHLQVKSLEGLSAGEIEALLPYKYVTLTLAIKILEDLGICEIRTDDSMRKRLHFSTTGKSLYEKHLPLLNSPVKRIFYCDEIPLGLAISGINALSRYTMIAPEMQQTVALEERKYNLKAKDCPFIGINDWEGKYRVELWKYPPIVKDGVVDRLSLALSLANDNDPRIQKELKSMINGLW